ncbi:MAG TPA: molybdopterin-dependent oxidoreductase, partial [Acidimicrobiales bacterium]|nr:molybdopterin-dependent oxidoreductase [Acidimicrobiales bacterium]
AAAHGRIGGLVLVGADPRADFPDSGAALRGMAGARFVVAVDTHVTESIRRHADVVLPASAWAERRGTFTNIEGRITWLGQLVTAKGMSWPDWMIASELASRLGTDLGFVRQEDIWAEITRVSPLHRGASYELIERLQSRDGEVVPLSEAPPPKPPRTLDPMADPGIASAELHNIAPTSMLLRASAAVSMEPEPNGESRAAPFIEEQGETGTEATEEPPPPPEPARLGIPPVAPPDPAAAGTAGVGGGADPTGGVKGLRLVTRRKLWDGGTQVQTVPSLANIHPSPSVLVHPSVLAELGSADGEPVTVTSVRGSLVLPAAGDKSVPEGTAVMAWNLPGARAGDLVDSFAAYTEVTVSAAPAQGGRTHGS